VPIPARSGPVMRARAHVRCRGWCAAVASVGLLLAGGCQSTRSVVPPAPIFYPQPPVTPVFQYLTTISSPADVMPGQSALRRFLFGISPPPPSMGKPYGLALKNGKLYVSDTVSGTIHIADLRNRTWAYFQPTSSGRLRKNIGVAVDEDDSLYVSDTVRGQVVMFDGKGAYRGVLGEPGALKPVAMELVGSRLYVADMKSRHVRVYDKTSQKLLGQIPRSTVTNENEILYQPIGLAVDSKGNVYVSDAGAFRIQVYGPDGRYLRTIGQHGDTPGSFVRNKGLAIDRANRLYAVDAGFQVVQLYDAQDRMLMYFGEPDGGEDGRMQLPADILIDYDHVDFFRRYLAPGRNLEFLVFVSNQFGDRKVHVYGFLGAPDANGEAATGRRSPP
jgi:hypothetical protein